METMLLGIKVVEFVVTELFVVAVLGTALILGLQQIVRDHLSKSHLADRVAPEPRPTTS
jgi:hypothetical protein